MALNAIIAENIWWVCLVIYLILRMPHRRRARREPISISKEDLLELVARKFAQICLGIFPLIYIITKFPSFANYPFFPPLLVIGTAAIAAALWCIFRAHHDLGRAFSVTLELREKHPLVTVGIYQYVRHPMYLGFLLWALAQALLLPNWIVGVMGFVGWIAIFGTRCSAGGRNDAPAVWRGISSLHGPHGALDSVGVLSAPVRYRARGSGCKLAQQLTPEIMRVHFDGVTRRFVKLPVGGRYLASKAAIQIRRSPAPSGNLLDCYLSLVIRQGPYAANRLEQPDKEDRREAVMHHLQ